jgi:small subunit ribosomal protein S9
MANEGNHGIGRRKTSVAQATIVRGTGQVTVNGRPLDEYFPVPAARIELLKPLVTIKEDKKFDVRIFTRGGGMSGQAGAARLAIARALNRALPEQRGSLKKAGLLTRDPRKRERKKSGQPGARKRFQFSKR